MIFRTCGDLAVSVELGEDISVEVNTRVRALEFLIRQKGLAGVVEMVPSFRALLVYYDPLIVDYDSLCAAIAALEPQARSAVLPPPRTVQLPCCYDPELGLDLVAAAQRIGATPEELVALHAGASYLVYFIGFTPGLPYMAGMPDRLGIPRLETPRTRVAAGSVGIGGGQCCIYSVDSPGGYWILGRTPLKLYDPDAREPTLLRPGDRVRFRPISRAEFVEIEDRGRDSDRVAYCSPTVIPGGHGRGASPGAHAQITIQDPGPQTTVQDLGRPGHLRYGIPPSGPVDRAAFILANRLVGNGDGAAGLECTVAGPRFVAEAPCAIAVTGAAMPLSVNGRDASTWTTLPLRAGDVVKLGPTGAGVRAYVAFSGGIDVPEVLGARATYLRGRLGGPGGRALQRGDVLALFPAPPPALRSVPPFARPRLDAEPEISIVLGPQDDRFTAEGIAALLAGPYEMLAQSDRMGARLRGPRITHNAGHDIISDGIALGSIQVPGDGQPIALLVDRQSTGGYTKVATVCSFDVGRLGQVKPGQRLRFRAITLAEAHRALEAWQASLDGALGAA
ncbi:MAG: 5-oxoprolinase subunit PxpB [Candidatus Rokuibacteriota bacterium]